MIFVKKSFAENSEKYILKMPPSANFSKARPSINSVKKFLKIPLFANFKSRPSVFSTQFGTTRK